MKHLFLIHSSITLLVARQVIKEEGLKEEACCLVYYRNFNIPDGAKEKVAALPFEFFPNDALQVRLAFWKNRGNIKVLDAFVRNICGGDKFQLYAPHTNMNASYLIMTHQDCVGLNYIEEGLLSNIEASLQFKANKKHLWLKNILYRLNYGNRNVCVKPFFEINHKKYQKAYGLSQNAFPDLNNVVQLELPFNFLPEFQSMEHLLVPSCEVEWGFCTEETYRKGMRLLLQKIVEKGGVAIAVKWHPQAKEKSIAIFNQLFTEFPSLDVNILDASAILEDVIFSSRATVYTTTSSVGYYAYLCGSEVFSASKYMSTLETKYADYAKDVLPVLDKFYHFL